MALLSLFIGEFMDMRRYLWWVWLLCLPVSGCQCLEQTPGATWSFPGSRDAGADITAPPLDSGPGVVREVECDDALNDRTDLIVDDRGRPWVGFHLYSGASCERTQLVVTHRTTEGEWIRESIERHEGIFSLKFIESEPPLAVYPNARVGSLRAAMRADDGTWPITDLDLGGTEVGRRDGFDLATDGGRYFVTFAENEGDRVQLLTYNTRADTPRWRKRDALEVSDPRAALSQGLRANGPYLYLVHLQSSTVDDTPAFGVARYDRASDRWDRRTYFQDEFEGARVHSLEVTEEGSICMASKRDEELFLSCGTIDDLTRRSWWFEDEPIASRYPASMIEGRDGTLYVAFHPPDNSELRLAERSPGGGWSIRTIFEGASFGVSTGIDPTDGDLVVAFYNCDDGGEACALKFLSV